MIDAWKHRPIFDPDRFEYPVHVIGAGATGSKVTTELVKLGITDITVWDADKIESHNVSNQTYGNCHIGYPKVDCLADELERLTETRVKTRCEWVKDQKKEFEGIVFLLTDTMSSRMEIHKNILKMNKKVRRVIETRMDVEGGRIYVYNPFSPVECKKWEDSWYPDEATPPSACGFSPSVGPTASFIAARAAWFLMRPPESFTEMWIGIDQIITFS